MVLFNLKVLAKFGLCSNFSQKIHGYPLACARKFFASARMLGFPLKCARLLEISVLFSAVSPRTYKRRSKQRNNAILSKLRADSFTMPDPQVPANAVQEAQAVLQNPAPDEAQAPAVQAHASAQADEVSLEVL